MPLDLPKSAKVQLRAQRSIAIASGEPTRCMAQFIIAETGLGVVQDIKHIG